MKAEAIKLRAVPSLNADEVDRYVERWRSLRDRFTADGHLIHVSKLCDSYKRISGYGHYTVTGKLTEEIQQLSALELSMLVDQGFSHFGGYSRIYDDGSFNVKIYTD